MSDIPLLSMVVPVHGVERYLPNCLESILAEAGDGLEIVAVDDHSPDGSGAILDGYAERDPRVRVLHLPTNVGLGRARNAGLNAARGHYVWFVDSDDWLPPGAVAAVRERLLAERPDLLVVDHAEVLPDGGAIATGSGPVLREAGIRLRPGLLRVPLATSVCTKVIRRTLFDEIDLRFPPGWYEDCAVAYPLMLAAERISALDRVCYYYRQRPGEAITRSVSDRHFEVFGQYERMWARVEQLARRPDRRERVDSLRPELFRLTIDHLLVIVGNRARVPAARRREFFGELVREYWRRLPAGAVADPGGVRGLRHRLVRGDAYRTYAMLRLGWQLLKPGDRRPRLRRPSRANPPTSPISAGQQRFLGSLRR